MTAESNSDPDDSWRLLAGGSPGFVSYTFMLISIRRLLRVSITLAAGLLLAVPAAAAEDGAHALPHHHVSGLVAYALERKRDKDEEAGAIGLDYGYRYHEHWSVGGYIEALGDDTIRNVSLGVVANWHPADGWALFAGPGYEFTETKDKLLIRFGVGYDFELQNRWTLGPKFIYDVIEGGPRTYILGLAIGREF